MSQPSYPPFGDGQWRLSMSLKALNPKNWIEIKEQPNWHSTINSQNAGEKLFLRVERQTLRRLNVSSDILFTIRTYVHPLRVLEDNAVMAHNLAEVIEEMPSDMQNYKQILPIREPLLDYLGCI